MNCCVWPFVSVFVDGVGVPVVEPAVNEKACAETSGFGKVAFVRLIYPLTTILVTSACVPVGLVLHFDVVPGASPAEQVA